MPFDRRHRFATFAVIALAPLIAHLTAERAVVAAQATSPLTIANCGVSNTYAKPPTRVVTLNQAATEVMLALGLQDRLVGTAYLDDQILPELAAAYAKVPVLAAQYPSREVLIAARPDFLYAAYPGAFGATGVGTRADWKARSVDTYLAPAGCVDKTKPPGVSLETTFRELREIARIFGVVSRADALIAGYLTELRAIRDRIGTLTSPPRVFWYDSRDPPQVGGCCGAPNEILKQLGATNIFAETPGAWATVSWEAVIARNPDTIVLASASWSPAADKRKLLSTMKALGSLDAIKRNRIVEIDFAYTTPGIRNVAAVRRLAEALYPDKFR